MAIQIRSTITLDPTWVDSILSTAFDGQYGAVWYWLREDFAETKRTYEYDEKGPDDGLLMSATLANLDLEQIRDFRTEVIDPRVRSARVGLDELQWACNHVLSDEHWQRTATGKQMHRAVENAMSYPEEAPDLDAEAADVLVQLALFGEVVYG